MVLTRKEIDRRYYLRHTEKVKRESRERYAKSGRKRGLMTPEQKRLAAIAQREWREANPEKYEAQRKRHSDHQKELNLIAKEEVLTHYGGGECACVICGESRLACLSLDHINGGGTKERKKSSFIHGSYARYLNLLELKLGGCSMNLQTLCMNCQWVKRFENNEHRGKNV